MSEPRILALETATEACSAALRMGDQTLERFELAPRGHGGLLLHMMDALLAEAGLTLRMLDAIAFGRGPGAFTGVRIATGVAQGAAFGAGLPVVGVSSLAALAHGAAAATGQGRIAVALDARIGQVYWAVFEVGGDGMTMRDAERVCDPEQVPPPPGEGWYGVGTGFRAYRARLLERLGACLGACDGERLPRARDVAALGAVGLRMGEAVKPEAALPIYVRDEIARRPGPRQG